MLAALGSVRLEVNECVPRSATVVVLDAARRATLALSQKRSGEVGNLHPDGRDGWTDGQ